MTLAPRIYATIQHLFMKGIIETVELREKPESEEEGKRTYLLTADEKPKYSLRMDEPEQIAMAEQLHKAYPDSPLLPKVLYADPVKGYLVQPYVEGTTGQNAEDRGAKTVWLTALVADLLNRYETDEAGGKWGHLTEPCSSWSEFNERELSKARENLNGLQPAEDCERVALLLEPLAETGGKYLLHGNADAHHFVFRGKELVGVLEPKPVAGPVLYDLVQDAGRSVAGDLVRRVFAPGREKRRSGTSGAGSAAAPLLPDRRMRRVVLERIKRVPGGLAVLADAVAGSLKRIA